MLGLPDKITACLFDLDGVLTQTQQEHDAAWAEVFNDFLRRRADGASFVPFDEVDDYFDYVDGRERHAGIRAFLASRGITLPDGAPDDPPQAQTVHGLGNRKTEILRARLREHGIRAYPGSVRYLKAVIGAGLHRAVVSSSTRCREALAAAGLAELIPTRVDGHTIAERGLRGKPAPDSFLAAARRLGLDASACAVFEDSTVGVQAGHDGGFGFVVGVDRTPPERIGPDGASAQQAALREHGASTVVRDLSELLAPVPSR